MVAALYQRSERLEIALDVHIRDAWIASRGTALLPLFSHVPHFVPGIRQPIQEIRN